MGSFLTQESWGGPLGPGVTDGTPNTLSLLGEAGVTAKAESLLGTPPHAYTLQALPG